MNYELLKIKSREIITIKFGHHSLNCSLAYYNVTVLACTKGTTRNNLYIKRAGHLKGLRTSVIL